MTVSGVVGLAAIGLVTLILGPLAISARAQTENNDEEPFNLDLATAKDIDIYSVIESLGLNESQYLILHDWSSDGKLVLFSYGMNLAVMDQDGKNAKLLDFSMQNIDPSYSAENDANVQDKRILVARFSPTDSNSVYILTSVSQDLFILNIADVGFSSVTDGVKVAWFDVMPDPDKLVLAGTFTFTSKTTGNQVEDSGLWLYGLADKSRAKLRYYDALAALDLSHDGTKLLAHGKSAAFEIFDLRTNTTQGFSLKTGRVHDSELYIDEAKWAPDDNYVVYSYGFIPGEPRAPLQTDVVAFQAIDGQNAYELIRPVNNHVFYIGNMLLNPDGKALLVFGSGYGQTDVFRLDLARAVPEFSSIALFIVAASMMSAIFVISRFGSRK